MCSTLAAVAGLFEDELGAAEEAAAAAEGGGASALPCSAAGDAQPASLALGAGFAAAAGVVGQAAEIMLRFAQINVKDAGKAGGVGDAGLLRITATACSVLAALAAARDPAVRRRAATHANAFALASSLLVLHARGLLAALHAAGFDDIVGDTCGALAAAVALEAAAPKPAAPKTAASAAGGGGADKPVTDFLVRDGTWTRMADILKADLRPWALAKLHQVWCSTSCVPPQLPKQPQRAKVACRCRGHCVGMCMAPLLECLPLFHEHR